MGMKFGQLIRLKGVIIYSLSPNELRPFAGMINPGFKNVIRRISENLLPIGIPACLLYATYTYGVTEYERARRKNPDDYKDEV